MAGVAATPERIADEGATVVVADVDADAARETAERVGDAAVARELDVRDDDAFRGAVDATVDEHGLDVLVNDAGVSHERVPMEELDRAELDRRPSPLPAVRLSPAVHRPRSVRLSLAGSTL